MLCLKHFFIDQNIVLGNSTFMKIYLLFLNMQLSL